MVVALSGAARLLGHAAAEHATPSVATAPSQALGTISRVIGADQIAYRAVATARGLRLDNRRQHIRADFTARGIRVDSGSKQIGLALVGVGYGSALQHVAPVTPHARVNTVSYVHGSLVEWYANGPLGLEQGFTLHRRPVRRTAGPLTLSVSLTGTLQASVASDRHGLSFAHSTLRYQGLVASDSRGHDLNTWLELHGKTLLLRVDDSGASYPLTIDPFVQQAKLTSSGAADDELGFSVGVSGDTVVAGAPAAAGTNAAQGVVYVFAKPAAGWANADAVAKLTASDGADTDLLGYSVAISGDTVVAGAPYVDIDGKHEQGAAYVFVKPATGWADATETAKLTASDGAYGDGLGISVGLSGDTVIAGAHGDDGYRGAAYVFTKPAAGWANETQTAKLTASTRVAAAGLGLSVAVSGDTVVAGADGQDVGHAGPGAAYVFVRPAGGWTSATETAQLTASDGSPTALFGYAVGTSDDTVTAGAPGATVAGNTSQGAAYVFAKPATGWATTTETAKLTSADGAPWDQLGNSVAVSGARVVAGARAARAGTVNVAGAAYLFVRPASGWANATETGKLRAEDAAWGDQLGISVAASGDAIVGGAFQATIGGDIGQGAAYVFGWQTDTAAPTARIVLDPSAADGMNGWYRSEVHASVTAADDAGGSGLADTRCILDPPNPPAGFDDIPSGCSYGGQGSGVPTEGRHMLYAASRDAAGNKETPVAGSFKIDRTPPALSCQSPAPTFFLHQAGTFVAASVSDLTSGPVETSVTAAASTATVGAGTATLTGTDRAGNQTPVSCPYSVGYVFDGFFAPVDNGTLNLAKAGRVVPLKWRLTDANGNPVPSLAGAMLTTVSLSCNGLNEGADAIEEYATAASGLQNLGNGYYQLNWKTPTSYAGTCRELRLDIGEGSLAAPVHHVADFKFS
jgi:hypothetical protein